MKSLTKDLVYKGHVIRQNGASFLVFVGGQLLAATGTLVDAKRKVDGRG